MLRRLLALSVGIAIAPLAATRRLAVALDDLAALAEHARAQPAALGTIERRVDGALLQIEALNEQLGRLHDDLVVVDAGARALAAVGSTLHDGGAELVAATRELRDGGADLVAATRDLRGDARDLSDGGRELVVVSRRLDQALGVIRAALPRMLAGLDTVENLEDAVETVAETVEPLQGAAERVGRVTSRLGRRSG